MAPDVQSRATAGHRRRPRWLRWNPAIWLTGVTALTVATATATAAAGPSEGWRLAGSPISGAPSADPATAVEQAGVVATPDHRRGPGQPGKTAAAPVAKISVSEADSGKTFTVKPGTEIDVTLKPDSGDRWAQPQSSDPKTVSRAGGRGGRFGRHPGGQGGSGGGPAAGPGAPPFPGPGQGRDRSTTAVFMAHQAGSAKLSADERKGGLAALMQRGAVKSWAVTITVAGPAPAAPAPKPAPKPAPGPGPFGPGLPGSPATPPAGAAQVVGPIHSAVQRLLATAPHVQGGI